MSGSTSLSKGIVRALALAIALGLVASGALWFTQRDPGMKTVTAYFPQTIGLYADNTVRVRGVDIGRIDSITPEGSKVKVVMEYDKTVKVPADAQAVIVAPSLVSDRYVQLTPAYSGKGPVMADNAQVGLKRTAVPLEVDDLYRTLITVSKTLGPSGANKHGELSRLLTTLAANFKGNGKALNVTINKLGKASGTLSGNKNDLFATIKNLADVTKKFAQHDATLRQFQQKLADVSGFLSGQRGNIAETVKLLGTTLAKVRKFIDDNHDLLKSNVDKLTSTTNVLKKRRGDLAEILELAPVAHSNIMNFWNGNRGTVDARANINELGQTPLVMVCNLLTQSRPELKSLGSVCGQLGKLPLPSVKKIIEDLSKGDASGVEALVKDLLGGSK